MPDASSSFYSSSFSSSFFYSFCRSSFCLSLCSAETCCVDAAASIGEEEKLSARRRNILLLSEELSALRSPVLEAVRRDWRRGALERFLLLRCLSEQQNHHAAACEPLSLVFNKIFSSSDRFSSESQDQCFCTAQHFSFIFQLRR